MPESFKQPSNPNPHLETYLAILGRRVEQWDVLKDTALTFDERRRIIVDDITNDIAYFENVDMRLPSRDIQMRLLNEQLDEVRTLPDEQQAFDELSDKWASVEKEVRQGVLKELPGIGIK
jgi:hypothetical protein